MKIREIINEALPVGTSGTVKTATGSTGTGTPNPAPAAKPYTDKEFQQALDAWDINDQAQKAKEFGKNRKETEMVSSDTELENTDL